MCVCEQGKVILATSRQVATEANYCMATGLHAMPVDDSKGSTSSSGSSAVNTRHGRETELMTAQRHLVVVVDIEMEGKARCEPSNQC